MSHQMAWYIQWYHSGVWLPFRQDYFYRDLDHDLLRSP